MFMCLTKWKEFNSSFALTSYVSRDDEDDAAQPTAQNKFSQKLKRAPEMKLYNAKEKAFLQIINSSIFNGTLLFGFSTFDVQLLIELYGRFSASSCLIFFGMVLEVSP